MSALATNFGLKDIKAIIELVAAISAAAVTTVGGIAVGIRERRWIKRGFGFRASDAGFVSLNTWMRVEDAKKERTNQP